MRPFQVRWQNYKGFADSDWLDVKPITVLIGPNGAGKSSVIDPLLLLKQTLSSRSPDVALLTRGDLVNLGGFSDIVTNHDTSREITLGLRWHWHPRDRDETPDPPPSYPPGQAEFTFGYINGSIALTQFAVSDALLRPLLVRKRRPNGTYSIEKFPFKPEALATDDPRRRADSAVRKSQPDHFLFDPNDALVTAYRRVENEEELDGGGPEILEAKLDLSDFARLYAGVLSYTESGVSDILANTSYLGPLREPLRRVYEVSGDPPSDVGVRGEWAPEFLYRDPDLRKPTRQWLRQFGFGRSFRIQSNRDDSFSIILSSGGGMPAINFADSGFGASQILPLIVQGLSATPDSLLITEQPEIHLNPRLQAKIADFFCHLAARGLNVLCETHSEHLLLRLRTLMAMGRVPAEDLALYFLDRVDGATAIRPVPIEGNGRIAPADWPRGFFQESTRQALALASEQNKRARATRHRN
jgi:hypothetical protein